MYVTIKKDPEPVLKQVHDLTGDIIIDQSIHVIDICNWVLKNHPLKAVGTGGRLPLPLLGPGDGNSARPVRSCLGVRSASGL